MLDGQRLLGRMLGGELGGSAGLAAGAGAIGMLLGSSRTARRAVGNVALYGGVAALGAMAFKAFQDWQGAQAPAGAAVPGPAAPPPPLPGAVAAAPPTLPAAFAPPTEAARSSLGLLLVRAMIGAAKADGHIDATEQKRIFDRLGSADLSAEEKAFVMDELMKPTDLDGLVAAVTSPEIASQVYMASLMAIDPDQPAERAYLEALAGRLGLAPGLAAKLEAELSAA